MIMKMYYMHMEPSALFDYIYVPDEINLVNIDELMRSFFSWDPEDVDFDKLGLRDRIEKQFVYWMNNYYLINLNSKDKAYLLDESEKKYIEDVHIVVVV
ncbi:MAG: hypothetical protein ACLTMR_10885 [Faecalibacillus sp.]